MANDHLETLVLLGLGGLCSIFAAYRARRRRDTFRSGAAAYGWTYAATDWMVLSEFSRSGGIFSRGHKHRVRNVVSGVHDGRDFVAFDFTFTTTTTRDGKKRSQAHHYGVVALDVQATFPRLRVTPEGIFGRLVGAVTNTDIEFESDAFNQAFTVNCTDRKFATDVLHPRMMELLLTYPDVGWHFHRHYLLGTQSGTFSFEDITERLTAFDAVLDAVPTFVWNDPVYQSTASRTLTMNPPALPQPTQPQGPS
jgi:hypothetical protein